MGVDRGRGYAERGRDGGHVADLDEPKEDITLAARQSEQGTREVDAGRSRIEPTRDNETLLASGCL